MEMETGRHMRSKNITRTENIRHNIQLTTSQIVLKYYIILQNLQDIWDYFVN